MNYTKEDILVVREGLSFLAYLERQVIIYRFWENMTIEEISQVLGMKWSEIDMAINRALENLRRYCLRHPEFSLNFISRMAA